MNFFGLFLLLVPSLLAAQSVTPLSKVNLSEVSAENRPLVVQGKKFNLYLSNGFCDTGVNSVKLSREEIGANLEYYSVELPRLISRFENLVSELVPGYLETKRDFWPLEISLSLDGEADCYNATAEGKYIEVPAQADRELMKAVFGLLYHEVGHTLSVFNGHDLNLYDEAIADAISLLLFDPNGLFYLKAKDERDELRRHIELGKRDPHALAAELEIEYSSIPAWLRENGIKYKCSSDEYYRDMRQHVPLSDALAGGGESYIVSCALHSFFGKLGKVLGHTEVLKTFVRTYIRTPRLFNELEMPTVLSKMFRGLDFDAYDPSFSRLFFKEGKLPINLILESSPVEGGARHRLGWSHGKLKLDWGVIAFKDSWGAPVASFSFLGRDGVLLSSADPQACLDEELVCVCPDKNNELRVQVAWLTREGAKAQERRFPLPGEASSCFEVSLPENLKTK